jgi:AraC-like DNA-binding protein
MGLYLGNPTKGTGMKREIKIKNKQLARLIENLVTQDGRFPSRIKNVHFMRSSMISSSRTPVAYDPGIIIVAQGRKVGYVGEHVYTYDPYHYLVLSVPLPFECEVAATPEEPFLAVKINVDALCIGELMMEMDENTPLEGPLPRAMYSSAMTDDLVEATTRLLKCLGSPLDSRILGPQIVREIIFRVMCGEQGGALQALAARYGSFSQIAKILNRIHLDYSDRFDIETLARDASMSVSKFHHSFKAVTSESPLQYIKKIRLHKARMLMLHDGFNATTAADQVGYVSASQFSREFKRFFGNSPSEDAMRLQEAGYRFYQDSESP